MEYQLKVIDSYIEVKDWDGLFASVKKFATDFPDVVKYPGLIDKVEIFNSVFAVFYSVGFKGDSWGNICYLSYQGNNNLNEVEWFFAAIAPYITGYIVYLHRSDNLTKYSFKHDRVYSSTVAVEFVDECEILGR